MPPDRRRRRFRRPGTGRWFTETLPSLRIELAPQVRATLTAWMRLYGEANDVPGLATGPIETRFARLCENTAADSLIVWTTPGRWAGGEGLSLRFPELHLEFTCTLADGHLIATKVAQVAEDARPPDREPGAVGVVVHPDRIPLPPEDADSSEPDVGVDTLERHFAQLAGRRWGGFAVPLREALEAEAKEDEARTQRLTVPFKEASLAHGGEEDVWRLKGISVEALRALDDGEWLEILDDQGRSRASARVIDSHPSSGMLLVGVRTASDPPRTGFVRPRSRKKILEQKRALLEELASPTGSLPNLVRLVAAPSSMPTPHQVRPPRFVNQAVMRNRSQARAVALALGLEEGEALLIQGPPGTGKSTTAAEIDVQLILRDPGVRVLVCSHSNHGTDNMLMKVLPFLEDAEERIARIGFYERIAKEARPFYAAADSDLGEKNIIFTTIDALVLQDIAGARLYDYVILDEANRAGVLDSLLALARGKRMVLVGDPMQLQPVMSEAEQQLVSASAGANRHGHGRGNGHVVTGAPLPGGNNVIGKSLFAWIQERHFAPPSTVLLDQQNRMHPAIGELVSRVFYGSRVRTGPAAPRRGTGLPAFPSPVSWVDTRSLRGNVESRAGGTSLFNVAEARLVTSITRHLAANAPPNLTIGVITAYAEQRELLRRLMGPHDWAPDRQLEIDTVDAFEGREKDIIVLSLVRANRRRDIGFLRLEQRLNVAVSRSRRLIIIVGDTSTLRGGYFHTLVAATQSIGQIIPAPKLIGQFLNRGAAGGGRRPRHERDERRRGLALPAGTVNGEVVEETQAELLTADGLAVDLVATGTLEVVELNGDRVPRSADAGAGSGPAQEAGNAGSRRRRRRAWERRRERMRALQEQRSTNAEGNDSGTASDLPRPALAAIDEFVGPSSADGETAAIDDGDREAAVEASAPTADGGDRASGADTAPPRRPGRRRRFGIPRDHDRAPQPFEPAVEASEAPGEPTQTFLPASPAPETSRLLAPSPDLLSPEAAAGATPTRRSRGRAASPRASAGESQTVPLSTAAEPGPPPTEPTETLMKEVPTEPARPTRGRRRAASAAAPRTATVEPSPEPATPTRARRRAAPSAAPPPAAPPPDEAPAKRASRARKNVVDTPQPPTTDNQAPKPRRAAKRAAGERVNGTVAQLTFAEPEPAAAAGSPQRGRRTKVTSAAAEPAAEIVPPVPRTRTSRARRSPTV